ncbi:hypothetical protein LB507_003050 [Fusarium sp. FIESC RH6]|nr:hypothetical protein LB507_003050 [Fusarium sp. FIESC RH6]
MPKRGEPLDFLKEGDLEACISGASESSKAFRADLAAVFVSTRDINRPAHSCPHSVWAEQRQRRAPLFRVPQSSRHARLGPSHPNPGLLKGQ